MLSLLTVPALLAHVGYSVYVYPALYYNPELKMLTAVPFMVPACMHAVCGMAAVFLHSDGTRLDLYTKQNIRTVVQRLTAAWILPLLFLHINTYSLLRTCAEGGMWMWFYLLLFYGTVLVHTAVFTDAGADYTGVAFQT